MKSGRPVFSVLAVLVLACPSHAYFERGIFSMAGVRSIGMGGAVTAAADDSADAYWNPAGLALANSIEASYEWAGLADGTIRHSFPAIAVPIPVGWGPVVGASMETLEFTESPIALREDAYGFSGATPLTRGGLFYAGGTLRVLSVSSSMHGIGGKGFGGDAGFLLRLQKIPYAREVRFGVVFQDFDGRVKEDNGVTQSLPRTVRLGMAGYPHDRLALTADFEQTWNPSGPADWNVSRNIRAGTAFRMWGDWLALRAGVARRMEKVEKNDRNRFFAGAGVNFMGFAFDCAWASRTSMYGEDLYLGASFRLGGLFPSLVRPPVAPEPPAPSEIRVIETAPKIKAK